MAQDFAQPFYNSGAWHRCRKAYAASKDYLCEICGEPGDIVHHKERLPPENINDPMVALNWEKLQLVCTRCHNQIYNEPAVADGLAFDNEGNLIEVPPGGARKI